MLNLSQLWKCDILNYDARVLQIILCDWFIDLKNLNNRYLFFQIKYDTFVFTDSKILYDKYIQKYTVRGHAENFQLLFIDYWEFEALVRIIYVTLSLEVFISLQLIKQSIQYYQSNTHKSQLELIKFEHIKNDLQPTIN